MLADDLCSGVGRRERWVLMRRWPCMRFRLVVPTNWGLGRRVPSQLARTLGQANNQLFLFGWWHAARATCLRIQLCRRSLGSPGQPLLASSWSLSSVFVGLLSFAFGGSRQGRARWVSGAGRSRPAPSRPNWGHELGYPRQSRPARRDRTGRRHRRLTLEASSLFVTLTTTSSILPN